MARRTTAKKVVSGNNSTGSAARKKESKPNSRVKGSKRSGSSADNKIFDDVYHTIITRMPQFIIPVINDAFGTRYPQDVAFEQLKNEFYTHNGTLISDSIFLIKRRLYHVECQSNPDNTMAIRMFEYGIELAMERARKEKDYLHVKLPESAVLYLRHTNTTPDTLKVEVSSPKGDTLIYESKVIKLQNYTKDVIFRKKLLMYLPFYIMRYEDELDEIEKDPKRLKMLLDEYQVILKKLEELMEADKSSELYSDLVALIIKISDYLLKGKTKTRKEMKKMGGQVLELYSDKVKRQAKREGKREGIEVGKREGIEVGKREGIEVGKKTIVDAVKDIRKGLDDKEITQKYDAETIKLAKTIA